MSRNFSITKFLITFTSIIYCYQLIRWGFNTSALSIYQAGGILGYNFSINEAYRLITPIFIHIGPVHFIMNMSSLYVVGPTVEKLYSKFKYLAIYLICGIVGNISAATLNPLSVLAGASTSIFGLFAVLAMSSRYSKSELTMTVLNGYWSIIAINLFINLMQPHVSIIGHVGGLVGGIICALMIKPDQVKF